MSNSDFILPFMVSDHSANGRIVKLEDSISEILHKHEYPSNISNLLAELLTASCLLGSNLKNEGIITCQLQSKDSLIKLLVAEYSYGGNIRGHASFDPKSEAITDASFAELIGKSKLLVTLESGIERYQGIIDLTEDCLTKSLEKYLEKSEQIDSIVRIATKTKIVEGKEKVICGGMILKKMPKIGLGIEDNFERFRYFVKTVSDEELIEIQSDKLLMNLFHSDGVLTYEETKVKFQCRCSRAKMEKSIDAIPVNEREMLKIDGKILVQCEFCNKIEEFV